MAESHKKTLKRSLTGLCAIVLTSLSLENMAEAAVNVFYNNASYEEIAMAEELAHEHIHHGKVLSNIKPQRLMVEAAILCGAQILAETHDVVIMDLYGRTFNVNRQGHISVPEKLLT